MTGSRSNYAAAPACGPSLALRQEFEELYRFPATVIDHEKLPCAVSPPGQVDAVRQQLLPDLPRAGRIAPTDPPSRRRWRRIEWHDRGAIKIDQLQYARLRLDTVGSALQMHVAGDHAVCPGDGLQIFRERHTAIWLQIARGFARLPRRGSGVTGCDQRRERDQDGKGASRQARISAVRHELSAFVRKGGSPCISRRADSSPGMLFEMKGTGLVRQCASIAVSGAGTSINGSGSAGTCRFSRRVRPSYSVRNSLRR